VLGQRVPSASALPPLTYTPGRKAIPVQPIRNCTRWERVADAAAAVCAAAFVVAIGARTAAQLSSGGRWFLIDVVYAWCAGFLSCFYGVVFVWGRDSLGRVPGMPPRMRFSLILALAAMALLTWRGL